MQVSIRKNSMRYNKSTVDSCSHYDQITEICLGKLSVYWSIFPKVAPMGSKFIQAEAIPIRTWKSSGLTGPTASYHTKE